MWCFKAVRETTKDLMETIGLMETQKQITSQLCLGMTLPEQLCLSSSGQKMDLDDPS